MRLRGKVLETAIRWTEEGSRPTDCVAAAIRARTSANRNVMGSEVIFRGQFARWIPARKLSSKNDLRPPFLLRQLLEERLHFGGLRAVRVHLQVGRERLARGRDLAEV